jgi:pimeloyl-ACP methyl ester carboxylesterase
MQGTRGASADGWLQLGGARLHYRDEGAGFPLVLVHGWPLDLEMWQPQVEAWSTRWRVVRLDRRGFGRSTGSPSLADDVRDLEVLIRQLGLTRFALLGMSQGARVALRVAAASAVRGRLTCLVLDGAPFERGEEVGMEEVPLAHYGELARRSGLEAFRKEWSTHPFGRLHTADAEARELLRQINERYPGADLLVPAAAASLDPVDLATVRAATLIINGEEDTERRRAMGAALCAALPDAERAVIQGAGHLPNLDNPRDYNEAVARFVARHTAPA